LGGLISVDPQHLHIAAWLDYLFASESVSEGHPDKVADQISDAILDALLSVDAKAHVACETMVTGDLVVLASFAA